MGVDGDLVPLVGDEFVKFILEKKIDEVLVCVPLEMLDPGVYQRLVANGVVVNMVVEALLGFQTEEQFVSNVGVNKVLSVGAFSFSPSQRSYLVIKRLFDILFGLIGLILLIPVTAFVKLAYLLSGDRAGIFYRQKRVGLNGKVIRISGSGSDARILIDFGNNGTRELSLSVAPIVKVEEES